MLGVCFCLHASNPSMTLENPPRHCIRKNQLHLPQSSSPWHICSPASYSPHAPRPVVSMSKLPRSYRLPRMRVAHLPTQFQSVV